MSVDVTREHIEEYCGITEDCVFCARGTRYWWRDGCMPVCRECASRPSITDEVCVALAEEEGYGPL